MYRPQGVGFLISSTRKMAEESSSWSGVVLHLLRTRSCWLTMGVWPSSPFVVVCCHINLCTSFCNSWFYLCNAFMTHTKSRCQCSFWEVLPERLMYKPIEIEVNARQLFLCIDNRQRSTSYLYFLFLRKLWSSESSSNPGTSSTIVGVSFSGFGNSSLDSEISSVVSSNSYFPSSSYSTNSLDSSSRVEAEKWLIEFALL